MATDYCDRSRELLMCAQLLQQKVMSGRIALKARKSRPGELDSQFANSFLKTTLLPLLHQASASLSLGIAKMDQLDSLTERYMATYPRDNMLSSSISSLSQKLQPEVVAISTFLQRVASVSTQAQQEFSGRPQICRHIKSLITSQENRLADLSRRLRDFLETNRSLLVADRCEEISLVETPFSAPSLPSDSTAASKPAMNSVASIQRPNSYNSVQLYETRREGGAANASYVDEHYQYQQQQQQFMVPGGQMQQQQMIVRQREAAVHSSAIHQTEATIVQLGAIYEQFAHLVREQADVVARIDAHVDESFANVDVAHTSLVEFMRTISQRRAFMLKFFGILLAVFCLFAIFKR